MHPEFIKWLSEQKYSYFTSDPINDDTTQDWILDEVIKFSKSSTIWSWDVMVKSELEWEQNERKLYRMAQGAKI